MFEGVSPQLAQIVIASMTTGTIVWGFSAYLARMLNGLYDKMDKTQDAIIAKLEYHEQHDDTRFANIDKELWAIKVRNASKDGYIPPAK